MPGARGNPAKPLPVSPVIDVHSEMTHQHHEQTKPNWKKVPPNAMVDVNAPCALTTVRVNHRCRHPQAVETQAQMHDGSRAFQNDDMQHARAGFCQIGHERDSPSHGNATYDRLWQVIEIDEEQLSLKPGRHAC